MLATYITAALGGPSRRSLLSWDENEPWQNYLMVCTSLFLVCFAGLMSGLTLGLMSLDMTQMEVLKRSGTMQEKKYARKIMPIIANSHFLLVTLLLCNAVAMEALPLFLDRLANPVTAILLSVTAVLFFGEIIPQSLCTRYGLVIGARMSWFVRGLMFLTSPISWPMGKLLDAVLGTEHHVLFRRAQLKALVDLHGEHTGLGGKLSTDEIKVITGALDLTSKIAFRSMTPLSAVFMLSTDDVLNEATLRAVLESGHSRIPIHRAGNRSDLVGIILVKELLQYSMTRNVPVAMLKMRSLPRLSAATPMYDMLKLFQTGRSHMAVLLQPEEGELAALDGEGEAEGEGDPTAHGGSMGGASNGVQANRDDPDAALRPPNTLTTPAGKRGSDGGAEVANGSNGGWDAMSGSSMGPNSKSPTPARRARVPPLAPPGAAIGIITIEDVIEELIRAEIVDETDKYVDNEHRVAVERAVLAQALPERLRQVVVGNLDNLLKAGLGRRTRSISFMSSPMAGSTHPLGMHPQGLPSLPPQAQPRGLGRESVSQPLMSGLQQSHSGGH